MVKKVKKVNSKNIFNRTDKEKEIIRKRLEDKVLINLFDTKLYRAVIFNDNGEQVATIPIKRNETTFKYNNGSYNIVFDCSTSFKRNNIFNTFKYFFYQLGNPDPIIFDKESNNFKTVFNATQYNVMLETNVAKKLNDVGNNLLDKINLKTILIILAIGAVGYYLLTGGKIL